MPEAIWPLRPLRRLGENETEADCDDEKGDGQRSDQHLVDSLLLSVVSTRPASGSMDVRFVADMNAGAAFGSGRPLAGRFLTVPMTVRRAVARFDLQV